MSDDLQEMPQQVEHGADLENPNAPLIFYINRLNVRRSIDRRGMPLLVIWFLCSTFTAIFCTLQAPETMFCFVGLVVFVMLIAICFFRLRNTILEDIEPALQLLPNGIIMHMEFPGFSLGLIPWNEILEARRVTFLGRTFVGIEVDSGKILQHCQNRETLLYLFLSIPVSMLFRFPILTLDESYFVLGSDEIVQHINSRRIVHQKLIRCSKEGDGQHDHPHGS